MANSQELANNAWHEAGHAAVAHYLGLPVDSVTIVPASGSAGRCEIGPGNASDRAVAVAAGPVADDRHNRDRRNGDRSQLFRSDREHIEASLSQDYPRLKGALARGDFERDPAVLFAFNRARSIVNLHWPAVGKVAEALLHRRTISGSTLRSLLAKHIKPRETTGEKRERDNDAAVARIRKDRDHLSLKYGKKQKSASPTRGGLANLLGIPMGRAFAGDVLTRAGMPALRSHSERQSIVDEHRRLVARPSYRAAACLNKPATGMTASSIKNREAARRAWLTSQE